MTQSPMEPTYASSVSATSSPANSPGPQNDTRTIDGALEAPQQLEFVLQELCQALLELGIQAADVQPVVNGTEGVQGPAGGQQVGLVGRKM